MHDGDGYMRDGELTAIDDTCVTRDLGVIDTGGRIEMGRHDMNMGRLLALG